MLRRFAGEKIELLPRTPQENEAVCDECGGTGWLLDEDTRHIVKCNCNDGVKRVCEYCKTPYKYSYSATCGCEESKRKEMEKSVEEGLRQEINMFEKAKKIKFTKAEPHMIEMMYSEFYPYNEGYFSSMTEFILECVDREIDVPKYVWATEKVRLGIDMDNVIKNACEDLHEDAYSNIYGLDELQEMVDEWCSKQQGVDTYYQDCRYAILI